jgi:ABC-type transporter MlaC component
LRVHQPGNREILRLLGGPFFAMTAALNPPTTPTVQGLAMSRFSLRHFLAIIAVALTLASSATALAETPDGFVRAGHSQLDALLKQPASAQRDAQIGATFDKMVDYDELVRRCFRDHWGTLSSAQQSEVNGLLRQIVQKNYKKNLKRTLDYNITYTGTRGQGSDIVVRTEAKSKVNPREDAVRVDYVVAGPTGGPYHVVDIVTESSSLTANYYREIHSMLTTPGKGYPYVVQKLKDKIAKLDQG